jgi:hypothetical protein
MEVEKEGLDTASSASSEAEDDEDFSDFLIFSGKLSDI